MELRKKTQARWRARNAEYATAWRMQKRAAEPRAPPARMPTPLSRLPWDVAKDEFGSQGCDFIGSLGRVLLGVAKDEMRL
jgi:hypothetical protein